MAEVLNNHKIKSKRFRQGIYIGRPSKWGNPFEIGRDGTREEVVAKYRELIENGHMSESLEELRGKDLICWCAPLACHGDVLLEFANKE